MTSARQIYILHAEIVRTDAAGDDFDDAKAGHPLERRLNRIERAAATYGGRIQLRFSNGMRVLFEGAESALLGACEMQIRCALLPLVTQHRMCLRIGIECQQIRQRAQDHDTGLPREATRLAVLDDGIVVAPCLIGALDSEHLGLIRPLDRTLAKLISGNAGATAQCVDWRARIGATQFGETPWPASTPPQGMLRLTLQYGEKTLSIDAATPSITIGRDPQNGLCIDDVHSSRQHCRIERDGTSYILTDTSTNGTIIVPDNGEARTLKNASLILDGRGLLFCGRPFKGERRGGVRFEIR